MSLYCPYLCCVLSIFDFNLFNTWFVLTNLQINKLLSSYSVKSIHDHGRRDCLEERIVNLKNTFPNSAKPNKPFSIDLFNDIKLTRCIFIKFFKLDFSMAGTTPRTRTVCNLTETGY